MFKQILNSEIDQNDGIVEQWPTINNINLVYNDSSTNNKVLTSIENELKHCDSFQFSVAFITKGGVACIKQILDDKREEITGQIITTDYLNFTEPEALKDLLQFDNIKIRIYTNDNFHTKGYIFNNNDEKTLIIGSSNLTQNALNKTKEWNVQISSKDEDTTLLTSTLSEFQKMWDESIELTDEWIDNYTKKYNYAKKIRDSEQFQKNPLDNIPTKNDMQNAAIQSLSKIRSDGKKKALLISATGTGKTYLSAFDVKESGMRKVLFLVHREQILDDAIKSYKNIFGREITIGKITGHSKDYNADFIFSTRQSMSNPIILNHFDPHHFEYIIYDEAHNSVTDQYQTIIDYFKPKFMLGMTATPERMDDNKRKGPDVFEQFDHVIAYEIRLQDALRNEMLCPFHYYGISDITVNGKQIKNKENFNNLTSDERIKHIVKKAEFYGYSGKRVKGLIFCNSVRDGRKISDKLNKCGLKTVFLCGKDSIKKREDAVNRLEQDDRETGLDYIITRDVFNEGVDIKSVNQIIMLRPTKSTTVFIQQLGRGLRKYARDDSEKEYLVVIDFIGNYKNNNYLIPIALSGDHSLNKENLRRFIMTGNREIPGCSTVNFDTISKEKIFESINRPGNYRKLIGNMYLDLVEMLGFCPNLSYLIDSSKIDPETIVEYFGSLNNLKKELKLDFIPYNSDEELILEYISKSTISGKRPHELVILKELIDHGEINLETLSKILMSDHNVICNERSVNSTLSVLNGTYWNIFKGHSLIKQHGNTIIIDEFFKDCLKNNNLKNDIRDVIYCGIKSFDGTYSHNYDGYFTLFRRYTTSEVCRLLNLGDNQKGTIYGYRTFDDVCPIFVTYHKNENLPKNVQYNDEFIDPSTFSWMSRSGSRIIEKYIKAILYEGCIPFLFVKKTDGKNEEFYYLGKVNPIVNKAIKTTIENDKGEKLPIYNIPFSLPTPVPQEIYDYMIN